MLGGCRCPVPIIAEADNGYAQVLFQAGCDFNVFLLDVSMIMIGAVNVNGRVTVCIPEIRFGMARFNEFLRCIREV